VFASAEAFQGQMYKCEKVTQVGDICGQLIDVQMRSHHAIKDALYVLMAANQPTLQFHN
jgi:hypothetical protein